MFGSTTVFNCSLEVGAYPDLDLAWIVSLGVDDAKAGRVRETDRWVGEDIVVENISHDS